MPVYVYKNLATGETFELRQPITEPALTEHPESGDPVKRLVQPVGIAFKGSGFYVTDSRSGAGGGAGRPKGSGDGAASGESAGGGGSGSDSGSEGAKGSGDKPAGGEAKKDTSSAGGDKKKGSGGTS